VVGAVSKRMSRSTSSSLPGSTAVERGLLVGLLRSLSSLESGLGVRSSSGVKLPGRRKSSGSYPAARSSCLRVCLGVCACRRRRTMSKVIERPDHKMKSDLPTLATKMIRCAAAIRVKARRCCVYWVREAISRSVRRSRSARARCRTRFRRTKSTDAERNCLGSYRFRRAPTCRVAGRW
jgi:hypothetical protein